MPSSITAGLAHVVTAASPSPSPCVNDLYTPVQFPKTPNLQLWWEWFVGLPLQIVLIVTIGMVILIVLRRLIRKITDHIAEGTPLLERRGWRNVGESPVGSVLLRANPLASARRAQRARTIGSVLRSTTNIVVGMTIVLMVLGQLGVDLAPFLASAGIAGVALGFGAQSLVKDFLSGTFMLLEDQYGVGDVVDFGEVVGTVEEVALRVTRVRDATGTLWFVRNGEIVRTGNKTQEWGRAVVEVRVAYESDEAQVHEALLAAANYVHDDPVLGEHCIEAPEVFGIDILTAEAIQLKVQMKTHAGMQWEVARAIRTRVRIELSAAGIALAGAQAMMVYDKSGGNSRSAAGPPPGHRAADTANTKVVRTEPPPSSHDDA